MDLKKLEPIRILQIWTYADILSVGSSLCSYWKDVEIISFEKVKRFDRNLEGNEDDQIEHLEEEQDGSGGRDVEPRGTTSDGSTSCNRPTLCQLTVGQSLHQNWRSANAPSSASSKAWGWDEVRLIHDIFFVYPFSVFSIKHYNSTTNQCEKYP